MKTSLGIRELAERAKKEGAFDLAQGVIDAPPPAALTKAVHELSREKCSAYTSRRGVPEYLEAVTSYLKSRNWPVKAGSVMFTAGVMGGITSSLLAHCRPGDTVLLPEPFFVYHKLLLETLGFKVKFMPTMIGQDLDWNDILREMEQVNAVIITSPANPTGQVASANILHKLSAAAAQANCLLLIDEMYREYIWESPPADDRDYSQLDYTNTVILRSFSKTLSIPGWRAAFAVTSPPRIEKMATLHDSLYVGGSTLAQYALADALTNNLEELNKYIEEIRQQLQRNKVTLEAAFTAYGFHPLPVTATYYMLLKHDRPTDMAVVEELMAKKIVTTPANIFFNDQSQETGYLRIHFAVQEKTAQRVAEILGG